MSTQVFPNARNAFATKALSATADTLKATALTMATAAGKIALISSSTNATPIALTTSGAHGYSVGDIVVVGGHATNTAANGTWKCGSGTSGTTINLTTKLDGTNSTGNGVGGATGWVIDITSATVLGDVSGNTTGTDVSLSGVTATGGIVLPSAFTWTSLPAVGIKAIAIYDNTVSNDLLVFMDGTIQLQAAALAASSATTIVLAQRLIAAIASGTVIVWSNGASSTLSAQANIGDTTLTVSALAANIAAKSTADAPTLNCGLPVTPAAGGNLTFTPDATNGLFTV